jgi:beta-glucosidase
MLARSLTVAAVLGVFIALQITVSAAGKTHRFADSTPIYENRSYSPAERAVDLVSRMTLAEKASQMISSQAPAIPRLGIQAYGLTDRARLPLQSGGYLKTITTIKHYALNNTEGDRLGDNTNRLKGKSVIDERALREYYTQQFKQIIEQAHPGSIMSSYNGVSGIPAAANVHLTDTLARQTFGFGGYFTSDCDAVFEIVNGHHWQPPGWTRPVNNTERSALANAAGEDLNCNTGYHDTFSYANSLPTAAGQAIPTQTDTFNANDMDTSLVRLFTARMKLGEFDNVSNEPWVRAARAALPPNTWVNSDANNAVTETPARLQLAREVGDHSYVLLCCATPTQR